MVVVHLVRECWDVPVNFLEPDIIRGDLRLSRPNGQRMGFEPGECTAKLTVAEQESGFGILNQRHRIAAAACARWGRCSPRSSLTAYGSPGCAVSRRRPAPTFRRSTRSRCLRQAVAEDKPTGGLVHQGRLAVSEQHGIPLLSLYDKGYTSIGCEPCTSLPFDADDPRSGRWGGRKQECGIHVQPE